MSEAAPPPTDANQAETKAENDRLRRRAATLSLVVGGVLLLVKAIAYLMTGSSAIYSDFLESIVHVVATGLVWWALRVALTPPDEEHPYGHGKAEYFSVGFEGALVFMAGGGIIWHTIEKFFQPERINYDNFGWGMGLVGLVALANLVLGIYLRRIGKRCNSPLLIGDSKHVLSDVWTTGGIFLGLALVWWTKWDWLDSVIALAVAAYLMRTAIGMMNESLSQLMDARDQEAIERVVSVLNRIREPAWADVHNLRLRRMGERVYVDFHLSIPPDWTVKHGHMVMDRIEAAIMQELKARGAVLIHLDCIKGSEPDSSDGFTLEQATRMKPGNFER